MGAEWDIRSWRNGFSAFILFSKRDGDIPCRRIPVSLVLSSFIPAQNISILLAEIVIE